MGSSRHPSCWFSSRRITPSSPTRMMRTPCVFAARIEPSTSGLGKWSPPIASKAMVTMDWSGTYSSATSTTSRPLYWPQCGQTRCGSLGSWQLGHSAFDGDFRLSWARRLPVRAAECRRLGFGIRVPQNSYRICGFCQFKFKVALYRLRSALQRSSAGAAVQRHDVSLRFDPQIGQMPSQFSPQTRCIGNCNWTCSQRMSSRTMPGSL